MKLRLPPIYDESGIVIPATVHVDLVTAAGVKVPHSVLAVLGVDLATVRWRGLIEAAPITDPITPEGVEIDILPQADLALPGGTATYYRVSYYRDAVTSDSLPAGALPAPDVWPLVQVPDVAGPVELVSLIGASAIDPDSILAGRLLPLGATDDQFAQFDSATGEWLPVTVAPGGGSSTLAFGTIVVAGQSSVVAEAAPDTLTLAAGTNITLTTDAGTDTVTITSTGGLADGATLVTGLTFPIAGLHILDTNASHDLILSPGSNLTADHTLTLTTGDADRTLTFTADASVGGSNTGDQDLSGYVAKATFDANTILAATADNTPAAVTVAEQTLVGRITAGAIGALSATQARTLLNVADGANAAGTAGDAYATAHESDVTAHPATSIVNTPAGSIAATTVQAALNELDSEKAAASHAHAAGDITSSTIATARLGSGTADGTTYLRGDQTWQIVSGGSATQAFGTVVVAGQSDVVADAAPDTLTLAAGTQITLTTNASTDTVTITGTGAPASHAHGDITAAGAIGSTASLPVITTTSGALTVGAFGTGATNFCAGNDARLSDTRTPVAHNQAETTITFTDVATGNASTTAHGFSPKTAAPGAGLLSVLGIGNAETVRTDKALFDTANPAALGSVGPGTQVIAARRDHIHANPAIDTLAAATDITTLNTSTTAHGLAPKAVAPSSGQLNVLGIANGETAIANKTIFDGLLQVRVMTEAAYQALGGGRPSTTLYIRT